MAAGLAMAMHREPSLGSCSAMSGDDTGVAQHNRERVVVVAARADAPQRRGRGDGGGDGVGRFGIYQGNWGGSRRPAELPEMAN